MSDKISTASPYYQWASEIIEVVKANPSFTSMRVAEKLKKDLDDGFLCDDCEWNNKCENCDERRGEPAYNEGYT